MKKFTFLSIILLNCIIANAQQIKNVIGYVKDLESKAPITEVTVSVSDKNSKLIAVAITDKKGAFSLEINEFENLTVTFNLLGYKTRNMPLTAQNLNLGIVSLQVDAQQLTEVIISGNQPSLSLKLDKKIFQVGKDVLSQTGSALELLNAVPSVSTNATGGVSLRGNSNVLVLINGRRSGFTQANALDQLPADQIERVEVITNPSSRYDATGSAGIINIILKKNKKSGWNGQLNLVGGVPNETRITPSLNYKSDKINLFSTYGLRYSDYVGLYTSNQSVNNGGLTQLLDKRQDENRHDDAKMLYFGGDFIINNHNTLTAAFLNKTTNDHDRTNLVYDYRTAKQNLDSTIMRNGESWEKRNYNQFEFNYTRTFKRANKKFSIDMQYDFWDSDKDWNLLMQKSFPSRIVYPSLTTSSVGASKDFMLQSDFVQPLDSLSNLELGLKLEKRNVSSRFRAAQGDKIFEDIDNEITYNELIGGAYAQFNRKLGKIAYQIGWRTEFTKTKLGDRIGAFSSNRDYIKFFPTLNLNYQINRTTTLQGNYSKRINRPSLSSLYPFNELTDFNSQYVGNPNLNPSYADVIELGFLKNWSQFTLNTSLYYQNNKGVIQDYTFRNSKEVFITTPLNIDKEARSGVEISTLYSPFSFLQLSMEANAYRFKQKGIYNLQDFNYSGGILTGRLSTQIRLPKKLSFQGRYNFTGAQQNAQSKTATIHNFDVGGSKTLLKDKLTAIFDVANLFNLKKFETTTTGPGYVLSQVNSPNAARYRLSLIYKLNLKENQGARQAKTGNRN